MVHHLHGFDGDGKALAFPAGAEEKHAKCVRRNAKAVARPMFLAAPVMSTAFPVIDLLFMGLLESLGFRLDFFAS